MYRNYIKRILDIIGALIGFPFFCIIFLFLAPAIKFSDRGKIFYNAERLGRDGKVFKMYKFRSMKENAPDIRNDDGTTFNSEDDPRVTRVGKFIRNTSLDETPQILNVLKGDMSIIGPRPDLPDAITMYKHGGEKKLLARPGITGYTQAYFRNSILWEDRVCEDIYYIENISFKLDLLIFLKTIYSVLKKENIYINSEEKEQKHG